MKKLLFALAAGAGVAAVPAVAQYANADAGGAVGIQNRIAQLDARLQAGLQSGAIDRAEAQGIRPQLRQLRQLERQYSLNGLSQQERQDLQLRVRSVRDQLRLADGGQGNRYSAWNDDGYYGQEQGYGQNQGYRQNSGYYGQGGPLEEVSQVCRNQSGIGGIIGRVLGAGNNCLEVGERVGAGLGGVPYEYRGQFRDGNGIVYRSDGRNIYQIDARTNTVLRIYATGD